MIFLWCLTNNRDSCGNTTFSARKNKCPSPITGSDPRGATPLTRHPSIRRKDPASFVDQARDRRTLEPQRFARIAGRQTKDIPVRSLKPYGQGRIQEAVRGNSVAISSNINKPDDRSKKTHLF
ncbi:hypothetical protein GWI33_023320 [Rhynchophorus ferrugineus]|uniref:Uncharacterized protein n=1 Tax=Rhynchophorus ferrugineus TaxID=354439 RepID=A0A834HLK1_RHYFE|nr:hypothetical protein GWI33_023320 [Rhynchophorus ferrugineus]